MAGQGGLEIRTFIALAGAILGFLRYNFNPATIFLGDSGSLFIGFLLSALALAGAQKAPTIVAVADRVGRTPAQVVLRWHIQRGDVVFPKSVTPSRVQENFELFDFELDAEAMAAFTVLNRNERTGPDPDTFAYVP